MIRAKIFQVILGVAVVGDFGRSGRENVATECPNIGTRKGTYDDVILEKGERSQTVRSYADITRKDV